MIDQPRFDPLSPPPGKPIWLLTLADLALLLVGFLVLVHATTDRTALAKGLRDGFGASEAATVQVAASAAVFAPDSASLADAAPLIAWARETLRDPRTAITVTGSATADEGILVASDRARAVAAALVAAGITPARLTLATTHGPARATLTFAFVGDPQRSTP